MKQELARFCSTVVLLSAVSSHCSYVDRNTAAIKSGHYSVNEVACQSTMAVPNFPSPERQAVLGFFKDLDAKLLRIDGPSVVEVYRSVACDLSIHRVVHLNQDGYFVLRGWREYKFDPAGCALSVFFDDTTIELAADSDIFRDVHGVSPELTYKVVKADTGISLTTITTAADSDRWEEFGCEPKDEIVMSLTQE